jgi:hypothetical protein
MLQRIQTIYLLVAAAASSGVFVLPFFSGSTASSNGFFADSVFNTEDHIALMAMATVVLLDIFVTIFLFKDRKRQALFALMIAVANLALVGVIFGVLSVEVPIGKVFSTLSLGAGAVMPLLSCGFALLARRAIVADERLVRSADRLR